MVMLNRKHTRGYRVSMKQHSQTLRKGVIALRKLLIAFAVVLLATGIYIKVQPYTHDAKIRVELESKSHQLIETKHKLEQQQTQSEQERVDQQKRIDDLNKQLEDTQKQLQAKRDAARAYAAELSASCGDNYYKQYIYTHESGCRGNAINASSGACGIGQALPCSKLPCSSSDWVCQDKWFSDYAIQRYGSWKNAYYFWVQNHWW